MDAYLDDYINNLYKSKVSGSYSECKISQGGIITILTPNVTKLLLSF